VIVSGAQIEAQDVVRSFPESGTVVDRVSLQIAPGEFVALLGPSGCGKSTFLRLMAGLDQPDAGKVSISVPGGGAISRGFVFQEPTLMPWRTVLRNVTLPWELMGVGRADSERRALDELARVGLKDVASRFPFQLSGGMKMRASVARALVARPNLLLLDEPFAALDETSRHALQVELRRIWATLGMTILFVTHSLSEAVFLANRVVVFSKRPARILDDHRIELPEERTHDLRMEPAFHREVKRLYDAAPAEEALT